MSKSLSLYLLRLFALNGTVTAKTAWIRTECTKCTDWAKYKLKVKISKILNLSFYLESLH